MMHMISRERPVPYLETILMNRFSRVRVGSGGRTAGACTMSTTATGRRSGTTRERRGEWGLGRGHSSGLRPKYFILPL